MKSHIVIMASMALVASVQSSSYLFYPKSSFFQSQDQLGQYAYGYTGGPSAKFEAKTLDGITRGAYSFIDANGILQNVNYMADPINGFRVGANPAIPAALPFAKPFTSTFFIKDESKSQPFESEEKKDTAEAPKKNKEATTFGFAEGLAAPAVFRAYPSAVLVTPQFKLQADSAQYVYSYSDGLSTKTESRTFDGKTNGAYSFVDANGKLQSVKYTADAGGFKVAASNLPFAPSPIEIPEVKAVPDETPEVKAAKESHFAAILEAKSRAGKV